MPTGSKATGGTDADEMADRLQRTAFFLLLGLITGLFAVVIWPFFGAVLWATILALLFRPVQQRLSQRWRMPNVAALVTLLACVLLGVVPTLLVIWSFVAEVADLYQNLRSGELDPSAWLERLREIYPRMIDILQRFGVDLTDVKQELANVALSTSQFVAQNAMQLGQGALQFLLGLVLMIYLAFFLLRDGPALVRLLIRALPLGDRRERQLLNEVAAMTRAMMKGTVIVSVIQGTLGGLMFLVLGIPGPLLWGVVMVILSMIPVVGAGLIWGPVAIYLFATGDWLRASILVVFGVLVIGLVDNLLRPMLVSRDTRLPDYVVLFSILGGLMTFGINGFVMGPLTAALFVAFWRIFIRDFNPETRDSPG